MSIEAIQPAKSRVVEIIGVLVGLLNALMWVIIGSRIQSVPIVQVSIWWVIFCLILNTSVAFAISRQRTRQFRRSYWIAGVTLFVTITCAFILAFWMGSGATDFGGLAFLSGGAAGGFIGFLVGIMVGINTSSTEFSKVDIIQRLGEGIITSMIVGIIISAIGVLILAVSIRLQDFVNQPNYYDL
jgi:hypothetical protein